MSGSGNDVERVGDVLATFMNGRYQAAIDNVGTRYFMQMMHEAGEDPHGDTDPEITERMLRAAWLKAAVEAFPDDAPERIASDLERLFAELFLSQDRPRVD
jgi:hypothetical protein